MKYELRKPTDEDLAYLSWNMRAADIREMYATYGDTNAMRPLFNSADFSTEVMVGVGEGKPCLIFGMKKFSPRAAIVWAIATPEIQNYKIPFIRNSRKTIKDWFERYPNMDYMFNFTHSKNHLHHKWLEWCGAKLKPAVPYGARGELFHPFTIKRETYGV